MYLTIFPYGLQFYLILQEWKYTLQRLFILHQSLFLLVFLPLLRVVRIAIIIQTPKENVSEMYKFPVKTFKIMIFVVCLRVCE